MAIRFAIAALLLVAAAGISAQQFASHENINELPKACQQQVSSYGTGSSSGEWSSQGRTSGSSSNTGGDAVCKLLPAVYDKKDQGYDFCLKCKAGDKYSVSAEELAQSIRQQVERKLKPSGQFTRKSKLDIVIDGIKKPIDLTRVLARTPDVLEQVDDLFIFFPNGQIGRIEFEHGQAEQLERVTCRAPCRGGPRTGPSSQSSSSSSRYPANQDNEEDNEDEDNEDTPNSNSYGASSGSSSSSRYLSSQQQNKKNNKSKQQYSSPYSYGDSSSSSGRRNQLNNNNEEDNESYPYGQSTQSSTYRTNAGRYGDQYGSSSASSARYNKQRIAAHQEEEDDK